MNMLESVLGGGQGQQDYQNFVSRYEQGQPHEGYSDQEVQSRYQQVATQLPQGNFLQAAESAFNRLPPQQRGELGQMLQQQAQQRGIPLPNLGEAMSGGQGPSAGGLAQIAGALHQADPNLLPQLLGGAGGGGSSPAAKGALAGIVAMAAKQFFGQRQ